MPSLASPPRPLRWLMIDNYDSFTYNLVQLFGELGVEEMEVVRNDAVTVSDVLGDPPDVLVVSPGPCSPSEAGISLDVIRGLLGTRPVLGVCLGHQCLVAALGGRIVRAARLMHGKTSPVFHDGVGIFATVENPFEATRYHSLIAEAASLPEGLVVSAKTWEDEIMAVRHVSLPLVGLQFHPESVLTVAGRDIVGGFVALAREARAGELR